MSKFYYLICQAKTNTQVQITLNDFPLLQGMLYENIQTPFLINTNLINGPNKLSFQLLPIASGLQKSPIDIEATLRSFNKGEIMIPEDGQEIFLTELNATTKTEPSANISVQLNPLARDHVEYQFQQNDFDYAQLIKGQPQPIPEDILIRYGQSLLAIFRQQDTNQFIAEIMPKLHDLSTSHGVSINEIITDLQSLISEMMQIGLDEGSNEQPLEVKTRTWCNQRIYELYIEPDRPLIQTNETEDGLLNMNVFVAMINEELKVVR